MPFRYPADETVREDSRVLTAYRFRNCVCVPGLPNFHRTSEPSKATIHPWMLPEKPWSCLHIDDANQRNQILFTKFLELLRLESSSSVRYKRYGGI